VTWSGIDENGGRLNVLFRFIDDSRRWDTIDLIDMRLSDGEQECLLGAGNPDTSNRVWYATAVINDLTGGGGAQVIFEFF